MSSLVEESTKIFEGISKMHPHHIANVMGVLLAVVAPGYLTVLHFFPKMFFALDNVKLFFVAISFSLPVLAGMVIAMGVLRAEAAEVGVKFLTANLFSFLSLYGSLLISWFFKLSFGGFILLLAACLVAVLILMYLEYRSAVMAHGEAIQEHLQALQEADKKQPQ